MKLRFALILVMAAGQMLAATTPQESLAAGRIDEAIHLLNDQIKASPNDALAEHLLCRAYFMIEDWDSGIPHCERATQLDPKNSMYFDWLGRIYGEKADRSSFLAAASLVGKVRTAFERAVALDPKNWEARVDLGEFYAEAPGVVGGGKDKARGQADALMSFKPAMAYWVRARIDEKDKDKAAAERDYRAAIEASHGGARAWFDLGNFFFHVHRLAEMDEAFHHLETAPNDCPESLMHAASVLNRAKQDSDLAVQLLRKYLTAPVEHGPAFRAHDLLGDLLESKGDRQGAIEQFRAALALYSGDAHARQSLLRLSH